MSSRGLTAEQLKRIEENRKKALAKRAEKLIKNSLPSTANANFNKVNTNQCGNISQTVNINVNVNINTNSTKPVSDKGCTSNNTCTTKTVSNPSFNSSLDYRKEPPEPKQQIPIQQISKTTTNDGDLKFSGSCNKDSNDKSVNNQDRIEQNRLKALAKRAEKLNKSPLKTVPSSNNSNTYLTAPVKSSNNALINNINKGSISVLKHQSDNGRTTSTCTAVQKDVPVFISTNKSTLPQKDSLSRYNHMANKTQSTFENKPVFQQQDSFAANNKTHPFDTQKPNTGWNVFESLGKVVKGKCVLISRDRFTVECGYSAPLIEFFKTMETKLYDVVTKKWSFKLVEYNKFINALKSLKSAVDIEPLPKAILQAFDAQMKGGNPVRTIPIADLSKVDASLVNSLMSFQGEGVNYGVYKNGRVLIADDMGLGKTIQAICLACYYRLEWPLLVVVPSSVRFDWAQQIQRWVPSIDPQSINVAVTGKDSCVSGLVNIVSYDLMSRKSDALKSKRFQVIIMDECHLLKNFKTARCKAAMPLLQNAKRVIMLSGTPALSRPSELYTLINAICPFLFKYHDFGVRYCDGKQLPWGWDFSGSSNMEELQLLLEEKIMIRRLKKEVLAELPDKLRQMVQLDPSFIKVDKGLQNASKVMSKLKKTEERGALLDFFHKSGIAKIKAIKNYVLDLLEGERKFIIFAHHGDVLDEIETTVKSKIGDNYMRIDGKTSSEQRNISCKKFQHNDSMRVAILSITAANAGLNLSAANLVVFAELFWNPGILVQAEDRAHRIGQQDSVSVHYLVATGTSDDHIWPMIQKKLDVLGKAGLTKDNFSSAETTKFLDPQQEEITKFLEESFSADLDCIDQMDQTEQDNDQFTEPKPSVSKQQSILKYTSPAKDLVNQNQRETNRTPTKRAKQKSLFQYYSPSKSSSNDPKIGQGQKGSLPDHKQGQGEMDDIEKQLMDEEIDQMLNEDDWDIGTPPNKKLKM